MVHKKYIKKGGKVFGPYLYETKRVNGKVVTNYIGKAEENKLNLSKITIIFPYILVFLFLIGLFFFLSYLYERSFEVEVQLSPEIQQKIDSHIKNYEESKDFEFLHKISGANVHVKITRDGIILGQEVEYTIEINLDKGARVRGIKIPKNAKILSVNSEEILEEEEIISEVKLSPGEDIVIDLYEGEEGELVSIDKVTKNIILKYSIPGSRIIEESKISNGKRVVISGEGENVLVYVDVSDLNIEDSGLVNVFWVEQEKEITADFSFLDGRVSLVWFITNFSEQTFDITVDAPSEQEPEPDPEAPPGRLIDDFLTCDLPSINVGESTVCTGQYDNSQKNTASWNVWLEDDGIIITRTCGPSDFRVVAVDFTTNNWICDSELDGTVSCNDWDQFGDDQQISWTLEACSVSASNVIMTGAVSTAGNGQVTLDDSYIIESMEGGDMTPPLIEFVDPTPLNGSTQNNNNIYVNVSSSDDNDHYTIVDFNRDLLLWLRMDDVDGIGNPIDISSYNTQWLRQGNPVIDENGYWGNGTDLDGIDDYYVSAGNDVWSEADFANGQTTSVWINPRTYTPLGFNAPIFDSEGRISLYLDPFEGFAFYQMVSQSSPSVAIAAESDNPIPKNEWTHLVGVWNGTLMLYVNGIMQQRVADSGLGWLDEVNSPTLFGVNQFFFDFFDGQIDDTLVFNRSLTAKEVLALYNASASQYEQDFVNLPDGRYVFTGNAVDIFGNRNQTEERVVTIGGGTSITLSSTLASGIEWDIQITPLTEEPALGNNLLGVTEYYVDISSSIATSLCIKADGDLISQTNNVLSLDNEKYSFSLTDNTVSGQPLTDLTTNYVLVASDLIGNNIVHFKFYLDVPIGQPAGLYSNLVSFILNLGPGCPP